MLLESGKVDLSMFLNISKTEEVTFISKDILNEKDQAQFNCNLE
jgi:hypothetical protein